jgi:hypothetical protein
LQRRIQGGRWNSEHPQQVSSTHHVPLGNG